MKVETSQEKLVRYQKEHEILGIDEKQNIITEKLDELNKEMTAAESDRMEKEAVYRQTQSGDPEAVAAAIIPRGTSAAEAAPVFWTSCASSRPTSKSRLPNSAPSSALPIRKLLSSTTSSRKLTGSFNRRPTRRSIICAASTWPLCSAKPCCATAFEKQKQEANKLNESAIEYSLLKRDVESNRTLYEGLLEKLKEAGVTAGLRSNNFRIIDAARVPTAPSEPNIPRNLAFALVLGIISGVGLAFLLENMDNTVRTPEQAQASPPFPRSG